MFGIKKLREEIEEIGKANRNFREELREKEEENDLKFQERITQLNESITVINKLKDEIKELSEKLKDSAIESETSLFGDIQDRLTVADETINQRLERINNDVEKQILEFHRESDRKYMVAIDKVFSLNRDLSLMNTIAQKNPDKSFENIKADLMQPFLEMKWNQEKKDLGGKIESQGGWIIEERNRLHNEMILREKNEENVEKIKTKISAFDSIIERAKK